jgi:hypothetical protein
MRQKRDIVKDWARPDHLLNEVFQKRGIGNETPDAQSLTGRSIKLFFMAHNTVRRYFSFLYSSHNPSCINGIVTANYYCILRSFWAIIDNTSPTTAEYEF